MARHDRRWLGVAWLFGLLIFGAVVSTVLARGEITGVAHAFRHVRPIWLLFAAMLQVVTYVLAAAIWQRALVQQGEHRPLSLLVPLSLAMLFSNQAVPSVGVSGGLVVEEALARRGTPRPVAMAALLTALLTTYIAFVIALVVALAWAVARATVPSIAIVIAVVFSVVAGAVGAGILEAHRLTQRWRDRIAGWPVAGPALAAAVSAPARVMRDRRLLISATLLQFTEIVVDAATLGVCLGAIGVHLDPYAVFFSYVLAATGSRVAFAPLGLGTFEGLSVLMLHTSGVAIEPALVATLVFRGMTLWLPMIPGIWCARRALR